MEVRLQRDWFGPTGVRYRRPQEKSATVTLPDEWHDKLPRDAEVVSGGATPQPVGEPVDEPVGEPVDEPVGEPVDEPVDGSSEDAAAAFKKALEASGGNDPVSAAHAAHTAAAKKSPKGKNK